MLAGVGNAVNIKDCTARVHRLIQMFRVVVSNVLYVVSAFEKGVEERDKILFVQLAAKDVLEAEIRVRTDVTLSFHSLIFLQKYEKKRRYAKKNQNPKVLKGSLAECNIR